ncbi:hypothetical protein, partial [Mesorhizobium sp. M4B.F.Ca.ET.089.01.1.1]|uniref:hypothetical protein n=1 Tax=Mesorhizobium sp. M4B.F.Ca.ET.089.01.1.1 TaxID=2496662 RepID=UPI00167B5391
DRISALRAGERAAALADLDQFKAAIFKPETCVLAAVFELVEAGNPLVPPCGRCAYCRRHNIHPPKISEIRFEGLDRRWPKAHGQSGLRPGISILQPASDDGTIGAGLIEGLVDAGIEQFIVPANHADRFAERLVATSCAYGLVSSHDDILGDWRPALMPTALIIQDSSRVDRLVDRVEAWSKLNPEQRLVIVAASHIMVRGKPIANILSSSAPIAEAALNGVAKEMSYR